MPDYLNPQRCCDLVMKGGITSGIVYPPAICAIAEKFTFVGIGGTSAGAIAAGMAAAAEYRRRTSNDPGGFDRVAAISATLGGEGALLQLFRPDRATRDLYKFFLAYQDKDRQGWFKRLRLKAGALLKLARSDKTLAPVVANGYGLCSGMANGAPPPAGSLPPLTTWLTDELDAVAGKSGSDPLTFGDLANAPIPPRFQATMAGLERRSINLRFVTTSITFGRPYELPFDENSFAFDPAEFRKLFPPRVCDYLEREAAAIPSADLRKDGKLPFPARDKMPVVVAMRMSLSFPGLFSMIPLYAVNYHVAGHPIKKVWFSDGGITSNFPIHRFDALFPRWPTLAVTLEQTDKNGKPGRDSVDATLVHMIRRPEDGALELRNEFDQGDKPTAKALGFALGIFSSAQNWHDNNFTRLPAYRDRLVEIWQKPDEGGLNLQMPPEVIAALTERGRLAGQLLVERFADALPTEPLSWEGHRWARLRSGLEGLARYLHGFKRSVDQPMPGDSDPRSTPRRSRRPAAQPLQRGAIAPSAHRRRRPSRLLDRAREHARVQRRKRKRRPAVLRWPPAPRRNRHTRALLDRRRASIGARRPLRPACLPAGIPFKTKRSHGMSRRAGNAAPQISETLRQRIDSATIAGIGRAI